MDRDCNKCVWHTDGNCKKWDCEYKTVDDIRADAIEEFANVINTKCNHMIFENVEPIVIHTMIADSIEEIAEQLKENL